MFIISDFIGENLLLKESSNALFDEEFENLVRQAEEFTSKENIQNYMGHVFRFLEITRISSIAARAEDDVEVLEEISSGFFHHNQHASEYKKITHKLLTHANFPYEDKELLITLGVLSLSTNFRIWACKKCLHEIYIRSKEVCIPSFDVRMFIHGNWHPAMQDMQKWLREHYAQPALMKIYLRAFDTKILRYYTRLFGEKTAYDYMREYQKDRDAVQTS